MKQQVKDGKFTRHMLAVNETTERSGSMELPLG